MTPPTASLSPALKPGAGKRGRARSKSRSQRLAPTAEHSVLGRYADSEDRLREVLTQPGAGGSVLVIDRDAATLGDRRLVAHLGADEPPANAVLACRDYLRYPHHRWCRRVTAEDLRVAPFDEPHAEDHEGEELVDRHGCAHRLLPANTGMSIPELRWHRLCAPKPVGAGEPVGVCEAVGMWEPVGVGEAVGVCGPVGMCELVGAPGPVGVCGPVGVRDVIATLESYEPVRALTTRALSAHCGDPRLSTYTLGAELERLNASRIVLNRGLREAVEAAVASGSVSMSEITIRCGRFKRDGRGNASGDTSWLARRVGLMPEGGRGGVPTPWVHSEVLALIARRGLGISPREVELG